MGDRDLKPFGVTSTPDVTVHKFRPVQKGQLTFLVVASDGVWDVLDPVSCADLLEATLDSDQNNGTRHTPGTAAKVASQKLADAANSVIANNDDVTAIVVSLWQAPSKGE